MSDSFTEITSQSWGSRLGDSFKGMILGILLIPAGMILLWWNEGRALKTANTLEEGLSAFVHVDSAKVDPTNDQKLVHVNGDAKSDKPVQDPTFGTSIPALRIERSVQIYQWEEDKKEETTEKLGGGKETKTTYTYQKKWVDHPIDSSHFKKAAEHPNTGKLIAEDASYNAADVKLGAFRVPNEMISAINGETAYSLGETEFNQLSSDLKRKAKLNAGKFYFGNSPDNPQVGDQTVEYKIIKPGPHSVLAQQTNDTFQAYQTKAGGTINLMKAGTLSGEEMFKQEQESNKILTWVLRAVGFVLIFIGFMAIMSPLATLGAVVPFIGNIIGAGSAIISFAFSAAISLVVIAIAWLTARPVLGITLLIAAVGVFVMFRKMAPAKKAT